MGQVITVGIIFLVVSLFLFRDFVIMNTPVDENGSPIIPPLEQDSDAARIPKPPPLPDMAYWISQREDQEFIQASSSSSTPPLRNRRRVGREENE